MNNFIVLEEICQTQFSTILRCKNKTTRDIVVLKEIRQKKTEDAPSKEVLREILIMMNFTHPHIVKYNSVFVHKCQVVIEMEFCITSLSNVIKKISKPFYVGQIKKIVRSIALGIKFLHDHDIIHRDIKPGNIFIDENCVVKIGDFGSARISPSPKKEIYIFKINIFKLNFKKNYILYRQVTTHITFFIFQKRMIKYFFHSYSFMRICHKHFRH